jgi:hypothetical protein
VSWQDREIPLNKLLVIVETGQAGRRTSDDTAYVPYYLCLDWARALTFEINTIVPCYTFGRGIAAGRPARLTP